MSLRLPDFTVPTDLATYSQDKIASLVITEEDKKHQGVLAEVRKRELDTLAALTGEVQLNIYVTLDPLQDSIHQKKVA